MKENEPGTFVMREPRSFGGKGKAPLADAYAEAEKMMVEYRHALDEALGAHGNDFELRCMQSMMGCQQVGLAINLEQQGLYMLFTDLSRPEPDYMPMWLLEAAQELTMLMRTLVVPDQPSAGSTFWGGVEHGPIVAYKFKLLDAPTSAGF